MKISTADFLRKIISPDGVPQLTRIKNGKAENVPCASVEDMAQKIESHSFDDGDIYHACASFQTGKSRKASKAKSIQSLWLDIDCGRDKDYETQAHAARALKKFCKDIGLPKPMIVDSGGGLHVYWPFTSPLPAELWKEAAGKLKALTKAKRLKADPTRTADAASVLRPVGSFNSKYDPPREVVLLCDVDPIDYSDFLKCLTAANGLSTRIPVVNDRTIAGQNISAVVNPNGYTLDDVEKALRHLNPWCSRNEWLPVCLALADAFGEDARGLFVQWSRGDLWEGEQ